MTAEEEKKYMSDARAGDKDAFSRLVEANQTKVYNLALKMLKNQQDALDVSQDAFIKAYMSLESFRGESRFSVWLYRLTYNLCIDFLRKNSKNKVVSITGDNEDDGAEAEIPDRRSLPDEEFEKKELRDGIRRGFNKLPEGQRQILALREISGMSYRDIAKTMHISEGTVKSRIARARQNLAEILIKDGTYVPENRQNEGKEAAKLV